MMLRTRRASLTTPAPLARIRMPQTSCGYPSEAWAWVRSATVRGLRDVRHSVAVNKDFDFDAIGFPASTIFDLRYQDACQPYAPL